MFEWIRSIDPDYLIAVPLIVICGVSIAVIEIRSWIKYGHSALF